MKKFLFAALLMILTSVAFADGSVKDINDSTISIVTLQTGYVVLKTEGNRLTLSDELYKFLLEFLKKNKECIDTFAAEQIVIVDSKDMGILHIGIADKIRFTLFLNKENHPQYSLAMSINSVQKEYFEFDQTSLNQLIQELENTRELTDKYNTQRKRVDEIIGKSALKY